MPYVEITPEQRAKIDSDTYIGIMKGWNKSLVKRQREGNHGIENIGFYIWCTKKLQQQEQRNQTYLHGTHKQNSNPDTLR